jgi:glutamine---fructose-6-phosphate transaminase (isomerizing)
MRIREAIPEPTTNRYVADILDQAAALTRTLEKLAATDDLIRLAHRLRTGIIPFVVLTGMGSSFHALHPLLVRLVREGVVAFAMETAALIHEQRCLLRREPLVLAVSQSGRSAEIIRLIEICGGQVPVLAVTNTAESPLAAQSTATVLTHAGLEWSVSCKTYVATLLALEWLGGVLCGCPDQSCLSAAPSFAAAYLAEWRSHCLRAVEAVQSADRVFLLGRGPSLAAAATGGLIIKESAHRHAEGLSGAGFRHGPLEMAGGNMFVMLFAGEPSVESLNRRLAADIRAAGGIVAWVGADAEDSWLRLPAIPTPILPILEILPVQMLSLALAALSGHQAGSFKWASKVTELE